MPVSSLPHSPPNRSQTGGEEEQTLSGAERAEIARLEAEKKAVFDYMVDVNRTTYYELGAASEAESQGLIRALNDDLNGRELAALDAAGRQQIQRKIDEWMSGIKGGMWEQQKRSAYSLVERMNRLLDKAIDDGAIAASSKGKWQERFRNPGVGYKEKERFVYSELEKRLKAAGQIAAARRTLLKKSFVRRLDPAQVPQLEVFLNEQAFLALHYSQKEGVLKAIAAAERGVDRGQESYMKQATALLGNAVRSGTLSQKKMNEWFASLFGQKRPVAEVQQILTSVLPGYIANWKTVRIGFDRLQAEFKIHGVPAAIDAIDAAAFLGLSYPDRQMYVAKAQAAVSAAMREKQGGLQQIEAAVRLKDWQHAEGLLGAVNIAELAGERLTEYRSLQSRIREGLKEVAAIQQTETEPQSDMQAAMEQVQQISATAAKLTRAAAKRGSGTFRKFRALMYNRLWSHENKVLTAQDEMILSQRATAETKEVVQNGHGRTFENNRVDGFGGAAIRDYEAGEQSAQVLHVGSDDSAQATLLAKCEEQQGNYDFGYWTTLIPAGVSYDAQKYIVENLLGRIQRGLDSGLSINASVPTAKKAA